MGEVFGWLGEVFAWVGSWIPRIGICEASQLGVKYVGGSTVRRISPGLYAWWPAVTTVQIIPAARQTLNLVSQRLTTQDDETIATSLVVVYEIEDVEKAVVKSYDHESTISDVALTVFGKTVASHTFAELREALADGLLKKDLKAACRSVLKPFGVRVINADLTDFAKAEVLAHVGDNPHGTRT